MTPTRILLACPVLSLAACAMLGGGSSTGDPSDNATSASGPGGGQPAPQLFSVSPSGWLAADGTVKARNVHTTVRNLCSARVDVRICGKGERSGLCGSSESNDTVHPWSKDLHFWNINATSSFRELTGSLVESTGPFEMWIRRSYESGKDQGEWDIARTLEPGKSYALDISKDCKTVVDRPEPSEDDAPAWGCYEWAYSPACGVPRSSVGREPEVACPGGPSVEGSERNPVCEVATEAGTCRIRYTGVATGCLVRANPDGAWGGKWSLTITSPTCKRDVFIDVVNGKDQTWTSAKLLMGDSKTLEGDFAPLTLKVKVSTKDVETWDVPAGDHAFAVRADCKGLEEVSASGAPAKKGPAAGTARR